MGKMELVIHATRTLDKTNKKSHDKEIFYPRKCPHTPSWRSVIRTKERKGEKIENEDGSLSQSY